MDTHMDPFETEAALMCLGGEAAERLAWLGEATCGLPPARLFDAARSGDLPSEVRLVGRPGEVLLDLMEGDFVVLRVFGEGPIGMVRVADLNDPTEVWPGERLPTDTAVLRLAACGCATCRARN